MDAYHNVILALPRPKSGPRPLDLQCESIFTLQVQQDDNGFALEAQVPGQLMAQTYTRFKTMANIVNAK